MSDFPDNEIELKILKEDLDKVFRDDDDYLRIKHIVDMYFVHAIDLGRTKQLKSYLERTGLWARYQHKIQLQELVAQIFPFEEPDPESITGELLLGTTAIQEQEVFLRLSSVNRHALIDGSSGSGKTTLIRNLAKSIMELDS